MASNSELLARARARIPGGVNSPVRAFNGVGGDPLFFQKAKGSRIFDLTGRAYIDYVGSWGPMIAGHAHPDIVRARVHVGVLVRLTGDRRGQVGGRRAYRQTGCRIAGLLQVFQVPVRMSGLALSGRAEYGRDIVIAFDIGFCREVQVATIRL